MLEQAIHWDTQARQFQKFDAEAGNCRHKPTVRMGECIPENVRRDAENDADENPAESRGGEKAESFGMAYQSFLMLLGKKHQKRPLEHGVPQPECSQAKRHSPEETVGPGMNFRPY